MVRLTKKATLFLLMTFSIGYPCFFYLTFTVKDFGQVLSLSGYTVVFVIGCLAPFLSALVIMAKEKTSILKVLTAMTNPKTIYLIALLLALHYGLAFALHFIGGFGSMAGLLTAIPSMLVILGLSELGWRKILFEELLKTMGMWRATICIGLFTGVCFIPLVYIPGFLLTPNYFIPFSVYLIGMGILSTTLYLQSGGILYSILFVGLFSALSIVFQLTMGNPLMIMFLVDFVIGIAYNSKALNKTALSPSAHH